MIGITTPTIMRFPTSLLLAACFLTNSLPAQSLELAHTSFENGRFGIEAISDGDSIFILHRFDNNTLDSLGTTPAGMLIGKAGTLQNLSEHLASGESKGFFNVTRSDLATDVGDSDSDGIKNRTELKASAFLHPLDGTDAATADVFDVNIPVTLTTGVPGAGAGEIETSNHIDIYRFNGTAGTGIFVDVTSSAPELSLHNYQMVDPYGHALKTGRFGLIDMGPVSLPDTGEYLIVVGDETRTGIGQYSMTISVIPEPQSFNITIGDTISLDDPASGAGNLETPGAFDTYSFTGTAREQVFLDTLSFSGVNTINYRLIAPSGTQLDSQQFNLGDMGTMELPETGTYTIEVGEIGNDGIGTYSIALTSIPAPDEFSINIGDTLSDGIPGAGAGNIETPGAFDIYTFSGTVGQTIFVDRLSYSGVNTVDYKLYDPSENQIASTAFNLGDIATVELPETGTYRLEVGEATNESTGTYSIAILNIPDPDEFSISIGDTLSDGIPGAGAGNIETPGAFDIYTFSGTVGQSIFVDRLSYSGVNTVDYKLYDPSGNQIASTAFNLGDIATVELPETGTYRLEVGEATNESTGTYSIAILNIPDSDEFSISIGDTLSDGIPGAGAGNIETPGAFDIYTFSGTAGQSIFVDRLSYSGVNTVDYNLYDPSENQIASTAFNLGDIATVELPETGTYRLEVGEAPNSSTGTYSIAILNIPAPDEFAISIGDTLSDGIPGVGAGNIETPGAFDIYTFSGTAGQSIFVDRLSYSGVNSVDYKLYDPSDNQIGSRAFNLGDIATVDLPETGTYRLEVGESSNQSTGTYSIALSDVPAPDSFAINYGDSLSNGVPAIGAGNIEVPGAYDQYTFTGAVGETVEIDITAFAGSDTINYRLLNPLGAEVYSRPLNLGDSGSIELLIAGTYTLEVGESNNHSTGTYSLTLTLLP
jgi:hypothetical protein